MNEITNKVKLARVASRAFAQVDSRRKNEALEAVIRALEANSEAIFSANREDLKRAKEEKLTTSLLSRLKFDQGKLAGSISGLRSLINLADPVGRILLATRLDQGLDLYRISSPLGVVGVIFESRPDALVQIACLALKSGNAVLLKGGSEARDSNRILAEVLIDATKDILPAGWLTLLEERAEVNEILSMDKDIDLLIPRGSNEFVRYIMDHTRIPVLGHADGICHTYVAGDCDLELAIKVVLDAKTEYTAVCNATETLLIDRSWPEAYREKLIRHLQENAVKLFGDRELADAYDLDENSNWRQEYLDLCLSVKLVDGISEAVSHINEYGSHHTDAILTADQDAATRFMNEVDSANVFWNCSTRFSDGFRYGFGAEVGVSTSKIHARGPVGLEGLLTYKYKLFGSGHIVSDYNSGRVNFLHDKIDLESI